MTPHVNQMQLDPYHLRSDVVAVHQAKGIVTETWSPLGRGNQMLEDSTITAIAERHSRTPAQVVLHWQIQQGFVPTPKSADPKRQTENLDSFGFTLSDEEMVALGSLDRPDPEMFDADSFGH